MTLDLRDFGGVCDNSHDDSDAFQRMLDEARRGPYARACYVPGTPRITRPLDATGAPEGLTVFGDGRGASWVFATLGEGYPVFDFTGSHAVCLRDLRIEARGAASAAVLFARGTNGLGDEPSVSNVFVGANDQPVGIAVVSADLGTYRHVGIRAGVPLVLAPTDTLGVRSKFAAFATTTGNTLHNVDSCRLLATRRCGLLFDSGAAVSARGTFFSIEGTATVALELQGSGGKAVYLDGCRVESSSTAANTYVVNVGPGCNGGRVTGAWQLRGVGPILYVPSGAAAGLEVLEAGMTAFGAPGGLAVGGGGSLRGCRVLNGQNWGMDLGPTAWNNTVVQQGGASPTLPDGWTNVLHRQNETQVKGFRVL